MITHESLRVADEAIADFKAMGIRPQDEAAFVAAEAVLDFIRRGVSAKDVAVCLNIRRGNPTWETMVPVIAWAWTDAQAFLVQAA